VLIVGVIAIATHDDGGSRHVTAGGAGRSTTTTTTSVVVPPTGSSGGDNATGADTSTTTVGQSHASCTVTTKCGPATTTSTTAATTTTALPVGQLVINPAKVNWTIPRGPASRDFAFTLTNVGKAAVTSVSPFPSSLQDANQGHVTLLPTGTCAAPGQAVDLAPGASCTGTLHIDGNFSVSDSESLVEAGVPTNASATLNISITVGLPTPDG
jgi:hypothetical protein